MYANSVEQKSFNMILSSKQDINEIISDISLSSTNSFYLDKNSTCFCVEMMIYITMYIKCLTILLLAIIYDCTALLNIISCANSML